MRFARLRTFVLGLAGFYLALCLVARVAYPKLLYPAPPLAHEARLPIGWETLTLTSRGPVAVKALRKRAPPNRPTIVWFHGNGELVDGLVSLGERFSSMGLGFATVEYRGYGRSAALTPSEDGLYADAEVLLGSLWQERRQPGDVAIVVGYSLGSAVAGEMAFRGHGEGLVLVAPFSSMRAMGKRLAPMLPIDLLMTERYDTLSKAPHIAQPSLVIHGTNDELVPFEMGQGLSKVLTHSELVPIEGGHHADVLQASEVALKAIGAFAERVSGGR